jgi:1-acyl-sn-glycerol-3-phosphate acyltransferase
VPSTELTLAEFFDRLARRPGQFVIHDDGYRRWTCTYAQIGNHLAVWPMREIDLASDGWSMLIFPEGERTRTGTIAPFQPGAGMIASRLCALVPIRLRGVDRVRPRDSRTVHPGPVEASCGPPMEPGGDDFAALAAQVRASVSAL